MDLPTPSHEHGVGAVVALAVSKFADLLKTSLRRKQKAEQEALYLRIADKMESGFSEMRKAFDAQNVVIGATSTRVEVISTRQEAIADRVDKVESALAVVPKAIEESRHSLRNEFQALLIKGAKR